MKTHSERLLFRSCECGIGIVLVNVCWFVLGNVYRFSGRSIKRLHAVSFSETVTGSSSLTFSGSFSFARINLLNVLFYFFGLLEKLVSPDIISDDPRIQTVQQGNVKLLKWLLDLVLLTVTVLRPYSILQRVHVLNTITTCFVV